ncbi:hypothetical protein ACWD01_32990 [Streptomyces sp. NPDC002835]
MSEAARLREGAFFADAGFFADADFVRAVLVFDAVFFAPRPGFDGLAFITHLSAWWLSTHVFHVPPLT